MLGELLLGVFNETETGPETGAPRNGRELHLAQAEFVTASTSGQLEWVGLEAVTGPERESAAKPANFFVVARNKGQKRS